MWEVVGAWASSCSPSHDRLGARVQLVPSTVLRTLQPHQYIKSLFSHLIFSAFSPELADHDHRDVLYECQVRGCARCGPRGAGIRAEPHT
jgi:hypothetical protein